MTAARILRLLLHPLRSALRGLRRLYDWTLSLADKSYGATALFFLAVAESSFFPVPPDVLLIALTAGRPRRWLRFAVICTAGSVLGGVLGYLIGRGAYDLLARPIIEFYQFQGAVGVIETKFKAYAFWAIFTAAFTPIPYKAFTISAGLFKIEFWTLVLASIVGRGMRFFLVAGLLRIFGEPMKRFIDRYFDLLTIVFTLLLVGGFILLKVFVGS
ncbi:hypothetical protein A3F28_00830 [Candidatus Uhrbacteria bacterium RIFCSPHIGHO2_12_FULL_57_11]|uniref:VTT domain-containing protein n=2 Tax=Candidatus Uhriibacteriota TaxID=1752732 RepID=A0A1F7UJB8_9BACT|nr:MAG: hypothetical protein A3D72_01315 [Candidatus Uhrbacteria bacterium RIFCSPHIGHO2_02_FULL_57_19]OGL78362.1 MAG: hypothetical protein A3F28_00830 [Candidatus Uhrbacteria bacterium RIFCSPHIGHO2_12_FULL_57_11]